MDAADPEVAALQCREGLRGGADEILLRLDHLVRHGFDIGTLDKRSSGDGNSDEASSDEGELCSFDAGDSGCAIYHAEALRQVLEPIDLATTRVAIDAGSATLPVLQMLLHVVDDRGVPRRLLQIEAGVDPIHELFFRSAWVTGDASDFVRDEIQGAEELLHDATGCHLLAVRSSGYHGAGASAAEELACVLATAVEYAAIGENPNSLCFRFQVDTDIYQQIAKLRAARLLWAKAAKAPKPSRFV